MCTTINTTIVHYEYLTVLKLSPRIARIISVPTTLVISMRTRPFVHVSTKNMLIHEYMELGVKLVEMTLERLPVVSLCPKFH